MTDAPSGLNDQFNGVATPGQHGDLLAFVSAASIALFDQAGNFLAGYLPASVRISGGAAHSADAPGALGTNAGTVYIFNIFSEAISVASNGALVGPIPAWSDGSGASPIYTPSVILAKRVLNPSDGPGKIVNGSNAIAVTSYEQPGWFTLPVDGARYPLNQSLLLFIARNHWRLIDQFGVVAAEGPVNPAARDEIPHQPAMHKED